MALYTVDWKSQNRQILHIDLYMRTQERGCSDENEVYSDLCQLKNLSTEEGIECNLRI